MKIILLESITKLGDLGDQVNVKSGYARNYLVPQGKAVAATKANIAHFETRRAELEAAAKEKLSVAESRKEKLEALELTAEVKAGDEGKMFGSLGARDIAELAEKAGVELAKAEVSLPEGPIRQTGEYELDLHLHADVVAVLKLAVVAES